MTVRFAKLCFIYLSPYSDCEPFFWGDGLGTSWFHT